MLDCKRLQKKLDAVELKCVEPEGLRSRSSTPTPASLSLSEAGNTFSSSGNSSGTTVNSSDSSVLVRSSYEQLIHTSEELSEEDKKLLWDSLFPQFNGSSVPE